MESTRNFCNHCGAAVASGQSFCSNCGTSLQPSQPSQAPQAPQASASESSATPVVNPTSQQPQKAKKPKKLWPIFATLGAAAAVAIIAIITVLLNQGGLDRTIMVYMIGSNLESRQASASLDINEMLSADFDPEHTTVLIYTGGTKKWALDEISADENAIFTIDNGRLVKVQTYGKQVMTAAAPLTEFINYAYHNYPADLYDLILWDHGGGPIVGYGSDENSLAGTPMSLATLTSAFADSDLVKSGHTFDFIGFDACLMGSIEVATAFQPYAKYIIASEETEPGWGWNYDFLSNLNDSTATLATADLGRHIVDDFIAQYNNYSYDVDLSLAVLDLSKVSGLISSANNLFSNLKDEVTAATFSKYSRTLARQTVYGYSGRDSESYDLVDLLDLAQSLETQFASEVEALRTSLSNVVIYSQSNIDATNGISVYFPTKNKANIENILARYHAVAFSDDYYDFLTKYGGFISGDKLVEKTTYDDLAESVEPTGTVSVELPAELVDNYESAEIIIFRKLGDNAFMPVYRTSEVELAGSTLRATTTNLQFVLKVTTADGDTTYGWVSLYEKDRTADYADYVTVGTLGYSDPESILGWTLEAQETRLRLPHGSTTAEIQDIRITSGNELASRENADPSRIQFLEYLAGAYELFDADGHQTDSFISSGNLYGTSFSLERGDQYEFMLTGLDFDFGRSMYEGLIPQDALKDYYAEFVVYDTQGDLHRLNLIKI